jgi:ATP-dependent Clp protease ATP-binding subunit ClpC
MLVKLPVLLSSNENGVHIAQLLAGPDFESLGSSPDNALKSLKSQVRRKIRSNHWAAVSIWEDAHLDRKTFPVKPAVIHDDRRYPAGPQVNLPVRYVRLRDRNGELYCLLPDFGEILYCPDPDLFQTTLVDAVRSITSLMHPGQVRRLWPPSQSEMRWLRVKLREPERRGAQVATATLSIVAEPLGARKGTASIAPGRETVRETLVQSLGRGSALVVGESGCGKSTLINAAARVLEDQRRAVGREERRAGKSRRPRVPAVWITSGGRLIAGMRYLGQWQQRLEAVIAELAEIEGILAIENLLELVAVGGREPRDSLAAFLLPYIRGGRLRIVAEATPSELDACRRLLPNLVDALPHISLAPLAAEPEMELIQSVLRSRFQSTTVQFSPDVPRLISRLCRQYQRHHAPPGPAMHFVDELTSHRRLAGAVQEWTEPLVLERFSRRTGLPRVLLDDSQTLSKSQVVEALAREVIGQPAACAAAAGVVTRIKSAVQDPGRPFASLLFCGPTGVGKTQLAKSLTRFLFGASGAQLALTRLDMSEYSGYAAGHRLLHNSEGQAAAWIQQIRSRPLSVLLLDEVEKASGEVFDILLSLLDEGRLTDRLGRVTSFRTTVVIMTSNLGPRRSTSLGFGDSQQVDYASEVRKAFRPEFFNRLDSIVPFSPLDQAAIRQIAEKELDELRQREGMQRHGRQISWTPRLAEMLARSGFDPQLGARPLQRTIETLVVAPLSKWLVDQPLGLAQQLELDWDASTRTLQVRNLG